MIMSSEIISEVISINMDLLSMNREILSLHMKLLGVEKDEISESLKHIKDIVDANRLIVMVHKGIVEYTEKIFKNDVMQMEKYKNDKNNDETKTEDLKTECRSKGKIKRSPEETSRVHAHSNITSLNKTKLDTLLDILTDKRECDLYIINHDNDITDVLKNTFIDHGCDVTISHLSKNVVIMNVKMIKTIKIKKLKRLVEKAKKFGIEFFLTKAGLISNILENIYRLSNIL